MNQNCMHGLTIQSFIFSALIQKDILVQGNYYRQLHYVDCKVQFGTHGNF